MSAESHALLSASSSAKWLSCPGALALESKLPKQTGSSYSREGTAAHSLLEKSLRDGTEPGEYLDDIIKVEDDGKVYEEPVTQDMVNAVEVAVEYVERLQARNAFYEERLDYSHIAPNGFGTGDVILEVYEKIADKKKVNTLYVIDYKHGAGIKVDAFENTQGMLYGLGALETLDMLFEREIERVIIVILQPRIDNISEYEISVADLLAWGQEVKPKAQLAYDLYEQAQKDEASLFNPSNFKPSEKACQWCQGKRLKRCKACANMGYRSAMEGFTDLTGEEPLPVVKTDDLRDSMLLDNADLANIYRSMKTFLSFAKDLDEEIRSRISKGENIPGLALKQTEKPRAWREDEETTIKAMRTAGLQKKHYEKISLISPTEAEKILKEIRPKEYKRRYKKLELAAIHRPLGKEKIVEDNTVQVDDLLN